MNKIINLKLLFTRLGSNLQTNKGIMLFCFLHTFVDSILFI